MCRYIAMWIPSILFRRGIDKKQGMDFLGRLLGIGPGETAAVGDGVNDYPMFAYAGYTIGIKVRRGRKGGHQLFYIHGCTEASAGLYTNRKEQGEYCR